MKEAKKSNTILIRTSLFLGRKIFSSDHLRAYNKISNTAIKFF